MSVPCFPERRLNSYYCCVWDRNRISIVTQAGLKLKSLLSCAPPPQCCNCGHQMPPGRPEVIRTKVWRGTRREEWGAGL